MSGICGLFQLNGAPVNMDHVRIMLSRIKHRGPDKTAYWQENNIALGHNLLYNTPESLHEKQPQLNRTGNLLITADARIDNREELFASLSIARHLHQSFTDPELILAAYEKWGKACSEKLTGDFAFAIWDKNEQQLFCSRDHMGVKPFYYHHAPGNFFAFASEIKSLLALEKVPKEINEYKIGSYLNNIDRSALYETGTFYKGIFGLAPANNVSVCLSKCDIKPYWNLVHKAYPELKNNQDYVDRFKDIFTTSIKNRLRSNYPVSSTLSGGLDSSSISCVAGKLLLNENKGLHTIYADCEDPSADEKEYVNKVLQQGRYDHDNIVVKSPLEAAYEITPLIDCPILMPTPSMFLAIIRSTWHNASKVLLTGHDGDTVVSHGGNYFTDLVLKKHFIHLKDIAIKQVENNVSANAVFRSKEQLIIDYVYPKILMVLNKHINKLDLFTYLQTLYYTQKHFSFSIRNLSGFFVKSIFQNDKKLLNPLIQRQFAKHISLNRTLKEFEAFYQLKNNNIDQIHAKSIIGNSLINTCEHLDHAGASVGIELAHPFLDKNVIELCCSAPLDLKFNGGLGRGLLRKGMKGMVPGEILDRKTKVDFTSFILESSKKDKKKLYELILDCNNELFCYVDKKQINKFLNSFYYTSMPLVKRRYYYRILLRTAYLSLWLNHTKSSR